MGSFSATKGTNQIRHFWEPPQPTPWNMEDHTTTTHQKHKGPDYLANHARYLPTNRSTLSHLSTSTYTTFYHGAWHGRHIPWEDTTTLTHADGQCLAWPAFTAPSAYILAAGPNRPPAHKHTYAIRTHTNGTETAFCTVPFPVLTHCVHATWHMCSAPANSP